MTFLSDLSLIATNDTPLIAAPVLTIAMAIVLTVVALLLNPNRETEQ